MPNIDELLREATEATFAAIDRGEADPRLIGLAIEANQRYIEYLDDLQINFPKIDPGMTIILDKETKIRFETQDQCAEWLAGRMD